MILMSKQVAHWKLHERKVQDEDGKLAPRVTHEQGVVAVGLNQGHRISTVGNRHRLQTALFEAALEELAQMCGAFLKFISTRKANLKIVINAGDALNFCDALLASSASSTEGSDGSVGR